MNTMERQEQAFVCKETKEIFHAVQTVIFTNKKCKIYCTYLRGEEGRKRERGSEERKSYLISSTRTRPKE